MHTMRRVVRAGRKTLEEIRAGFSDGAKFRVCEPADLVPGKTFYRVPWGGFAGAYSLEPSYSVAKEGRRCEVVARPPDSRADPEECFFFSFLDETPHPQFGRDVLEERKEDARSPVIRKSAHCSFMVSLVPI